MSLINVTQHFRLSAAHTDITNNTKQECIQRISFFCRVPGKGLLRRKSDEYVGAGAAADWTNVTAQ